MAATFEYLRLLTDARVEFVLVGGLAAVLHGSARITEDVDVCAPLDRANLERIVSALGPYQPKFRFHPKEPSLPEDAEKLVGFRNLNLITTLGKIDILGEITGVGGFDEVVRHSVWIDVDSLRVRVLDLDALITAKKATGRLKDRMAVPELEAIRERLRKPNG